MKVEDNSEVYGQDEEEGQVQDENVYYGEVGPELTFTCCPGYLPGGGQQGQGQQLPLWRGLGLISTYM